MLPCWTLLLVVLLCLGVGGCATGEVAMVATIAGGQKIRVPIGPGGTVLTNEGGVQIRLANFFVNKDKKIVYSFAFADIRDRALQRVQVQDLSDEVAVMLLDDTQPKSERDGVWHRESEPFEFNDPRLSWIATISNSLRVFRFTLTFSDGKTMVLQQGMLYPAGLKESVRHIFGMTY